MQLVASHWICGLDLRHMAHTHYTHIIIIILLDRINLLNLGFAKELSKALLPFTFAFALASTHLLAFPWSPARLRSHNPAGRACPIFILHQHNDESESWFLWFSFCFSLHWRSGLDGGGVYTYV